MKVLFSPQLANKVLDEKMFFSKEIFIILLIVPITTCFKVQSLENIKAFSTALNTLVKDQYVGKVWHLDFYVIGNVWCQKFSLNVIKNVIEKNSGDLKSKVSTFTCNKYGLKTKIKVENSAVFFIETENQIKLLNEQVEMTNVDYMKFHHTVIILKKIKENLNITKLFDKMSYDSLINYEVLMFHQDNYIKLATIQQFHTSKCETSLRVINYFSFATQNWKNQEFGLIKFQHFNGCNIKVQRFDKKDAVLPFVLYDVYDSLKSKLKVKMKKTIVHTDSEVIYNNYMKKSSTKSVSVNEIDDILYVSDYNENNTLFVYKFFDNEIGCMVHVGEEYTSYEKFYLPFDHGTWICCGLTFSGAFITIFIINSLCNRMIHEVVYGS